MPRRRERDKDKDKKKKKGLMRLQQRKRTCKFCADKALRLDFKNAQQMGIFLNERGKIFPRRLTGACAKHQRAITLAIKRSRILAVVPFSSTQLR